jgi:very-short-patch-repair endonuclease
MPTKQEKAALQKRIRAATLHVALSQIEVRTDTESALEYKFHPVRKWRFDVAFPDAKVAAEIDGGAWSAGRHTRGAGFIADQKKTNAAALLGWSVYRFTWEDLKTAYFVDTLTEALAAKKAA